MALTKDLSAVYENFNQEFLIFNHVNSANSAIENINHCLSLGLTKTNYEMSLNCPGHSTQSPSTRKLKYDVISQSINLKKLLLFC